MPVQLLGAQFPQWERRGSHKGWRDSDCLSSLSGEVDDELWGGGMNRVLTVPPMKQCSQR